MAVSALIRLIDEQFRSFPVGVLPHDYTAVGEYHYRPASGHMGIWFEPNRDTSWGGKYCWVIRSVDGVRHLEQSLSPEDLPWASTTCPLLAAGDAEWADYTAAATVRPLFARHWCGIGFRYQSARQYYLFAIDSGKRACLYRKNEESFDVVASADFVSDTDHSYRLQVQVKGPHVICFIDDAVVLDYKKLDLPKGKVLVSAWEPSRFTDITVDMSEDSYAAVSETNAAKRAALADKQKQYPAMRLAKILDFKDFGTARSIRFGDLTGNGQLDMLLIQPADTLSNHDETTIGCMTACDFHGHMLWQIGEVQTRDPVECKDMPCQIADFNGDGQNEVIYCSDFKIIVADGKTGRTIKSAPTPFAVYTEEYTIARNVNYTRISGDSLRIVYPNGRNALPCLLIKDRYNNLWLYDNDLREVWHHALNTGHFPMSFDINGDGKEEIIAGHSYINSAGAIKWSLPGMECHTDEIIIGKWNPDYEGYLIGLASGEDGIVITDTEGRIVLQDHIGHAQRISVGNYRPDLTGLEVCVTTYWRNPGIITLYDGKGAKLWVNEHSANGNVIAPVNWVGDGSDLLLYSASVTHGGLYDGFGDLVVPFPADGHPELCCEAMDLFGDNRDELLVWDRNKMYIYTQADSPKATAAAPTKYPHENGSNYRGEYAYREGE